MSKLEVFDPAMCCSTGVCGPSPDQKLVAFAGVLKGFEGDAEIHRYNLGQEPQAFVENAVVNAILQREGADALPVILVDGELVMKGVYPSKEQLEDLLDAGSCCGGDDDCCGGEAETSCCGDDDACCESEEPKAAASSCCDDSGCC